MHYGFTDDELDLARSLASVLSAVVPPHQGEDPDSGGTGVDDRLWSELTRGGWLAAFQLKDQSVSRPAMVALGEVLGRAGVRIPWVNTFGLVLPLIEKLPSEVAKDLLAALGDGAIVTSPAGGFNQEELVVSALKGGESRITGVIPFVPYARDAQSILALASGEDGSPLLVTIDTRANGVELRDVHSADLLNDYADVILDEAPTLVVSADYELLRDEIHNAELQYSLFLSAEAIGGLDGLLTRAIDYVCQRHQFGVPIGSFQSVKHMLANVSTSVHSGQAITYLAASAMESGLGMGPADVECARIYTANNYLHGSEVIIQAHGGFGFTWESGLHIWYRNAMANYHLPNRMRSLASLER